MKITEYVSKSDLRELRARMKSAEKSANDWIIHYINKRRSALTEQEERELINRQAGCEAHLKEYRTTLAMIEEIERLRSLLKRIDRNTKRASKKKSKV